MADLPSLDDKARRIQEIANSLGWNSDINSLVTRVKEMDLGLVQEDEFIYILNWSQKCELIHKIDQFIIPSKAKKKFTIPDLFVVFNQNGKKEPYFIEVKTSKVAKLSWTETYYQGLLNYSKLTGIPVLIAWKWRTFDIWTLFDPKYFQKAVSNYKIGFEKAHVENLMSKLAGDYFVVPYDDIGIHFKFRKVKKVKDDESGITWESICESIFLSGEGGKEIEDLDSGLLAFILSFPMNQEVIESETHIQYTYRPDPNKSAFAQSIPIRLTQAFADGEINWLEKIKNEDYPIKYQLLYDSLLNGIEKGIIRNIFILKPKTEE